MSLNKSKTNQPNAERPKMPAGFWLDLDSSPPRSSQKTKEMATKNKRKIKSSSIQESVGVASRFQKGPRRLNVMVHRMLQAMNRSREEPRS